MRVLLSAYACEPGKGSEPGAGWNWALAAAENHEVWVMTRTNNRQVIEKALAGRDHDSLHFVYLDLPRRLRWWKRGARGVRAYYVLWQLLAAREARRLHRRHEFHLIHHVTFANAWLPALAAVPGAPFLLGPVGGGPRVPLPLYRALGIGGVTHEVFLVTARLLSHANPLTRLGWRRAAVILVQNEETKASLPRRYRPKAVVRPNASIERQPELRLETEDRTTPERPTVIYAGRLVPWKGVSLAILALRHLPRWQLLVVGEGSDERRLHRLVSRYGLGGQVTFVPWLSQAELWQRLASCQAMIVPSLRDDASFISVEAQALGVPVVAFGRGGPAVLARFPDTHFELVPLGSREQSIDALVGALERLDGAPRRGRRADFGLRGVTRDLDVVYTAALQPVPRPPLEAYAG